MKMKVIKKSLLVVLIISSQLSTSALAEPDQLDFLGLIPDVSELSQFLEVGKEISGPRGFSKNFRFFKIGEHDIPCAVGFINNRLADLTCFTGQRDGEERWTESSNIVVHSDIKAWFTKKFGNPDSVEQNPERTHMGVEDELEKVSWKDKRGNELQLSSMFWSVDAGIITLYSSEFLKHIEKMTSSDNRDRKKVKKQRD
jgi:hypothetical protein